MKLSLIAGLAIVALSTSSPAFARPVVAHVSGTVMCRQLGHPGRYTTACSETTRYVLLTSDKTAWTIKHQNFTALRQLVGEFVNVTGEVEGHQIDILQVAGVPVDCVED